MRQRHYFFFALVQVFLSLSPCSPVFSQGLYSARAYWEESNRPTYLSLQRKLAKGDSLTANEKFYIQDYETYLATYFGRLTTEEKEKYDNMKPQWDHELDVIPVTPSDKEFEWRGRDRLANGIYGFYYGVSIVALGEVDNA